MDLLKTISLIGYCLIVLIGLVIGGLYSFAPRIMPYHLKAMNTSWELLDKGQQCMVLNYQRSVAAGFIATSAALLFLIIFPFLKNELWAYFALFIIGMIEWGILVIKTISVKVNTQANPPLGLLISILCILTISFIVSLISYKIKG